MPNAPTDLHRSQQLLENAKRLIEHAATSLVQSRVLIRRGEARAVARERASLTDKAPAVEWRSISATASEDTYLGVV